jgi:hypothetical protein
MNSHISVYEAPSMVMLDKKSIKIEGVLDFEWCPDKERGVGKDKENMLAYWTPEVENQPARVSLLAVPSRKVLRQKNLFNVSDVSRSCCIDTTTSCADPRVTRPRVNSANFTGKISVTTSASRSTDSPRPRRTFTPTSSSSE